jgi:hypothetical protein
MDYYRSARRKIRTALTLSHGDLGIFIKAWFWLLVIDLLLRSLPFPRVQQFVASQIKVRGAIPSGQAWETIRRNQRLVILAARNHLYRMECLRQALTLKGMLGAQGIPTELRFGARKTEEGFLAHAWLEYERQSIELAQNGKERFEPLKTLEDRG